jgi:hypothetical protein
MGLIKCSRPGGLNILRDRSQDAPSFPDILVLYNTSLKHITPWPEPPSPISNKSFEFFLFVPASVRRKIWTFALPGPPVIEIYNANKQREFRSPLPFLLHANRDARSVVLTHYETPAASPLNDLNSALGHHNLTYLNFERDTFCPVISLRSFITGEWRTFLGTLPNCERIQRFGLPKRCFLFPTPACIPLLLQYSSLREVVVLADPCIDHHPHKDARNEKGWCLDAGEVLPMLQEFNERKRNEEVPEGHAVAYMDKLREARRETQSGTCVLFIRWFVGVEGAGKQGVRPWRRARMGERGGNRGRGRRLGG